MSLLCWCLPPRRLRQEARGRPLAALLAPTARSPKIEAADPNRGDPTGALRRVLAAAWRTLGRFHALVAINVQLPPAELRRRHHSVLAALEPLIERGQREGAFRSDVPPGWQLSMILALVHAASAELQAGRMPADEVESAIIATVLGAISAHAGSAS